MKLKSALLTTILRGPENLFCKFIHITNDETIIDTDNTDIQTAELVFLAVIIPCFGEMVLADTEYYM